MPKPLYGNPWQKARATYLASHPDCVICGSPAVVVDHIIPHRGNWALFWDRSHSDSKLMAWCVSNIKIEPTATAIRATKQNAGDAKIDAAMAMFNAVQVMTQLPAKAPEYQLIFA